MVVPWSGVGPTTGSYVAGPKCWCQVRVECVLGPGDDQVILARSQSRVQGGVDEERDRAVTAHDGIERVVVARQQHRLTVHDAEERQAGVERRADAVGEQVGDEPILAGTAMTKW